MNFLKKVTHKLPYQCDVLFDKFPELDLKALQDFIKTTDPGEKDKCTVEKATHQRNDQVEIFGFAAHLGEMSIAALVHSVPSPAAESMDLCLLKPELIADLKDHSAFALLTCLEGDDYMPIEKTIFLFKVAIGLCRQGGKGIHFLHNNFLFPTPLLAAILKNAGEISEDRYASVWDILRNEHVPQELVFQIRAMPSRDGRKWLVSRGGAHCGFPDLISELGPTTDREALQEAFSGYFHYCMENGPVIEAGHTMGGSEEDKAMRFSAAPKGLVMPFEYQPETMLGLSV